VEEDKVKAASEQLQRFREHPEHPEFTTVARKAREVRRQVMEEESKPQTRFFTREDIFANTKPYGVGMVTFSVIAICVFVAFYTNLGSEVENANPFRITEVQKNGDVYSWFPGLLEIRNGQIWRLVGPIFLHFGPIHLLFNMMWLFDLGSMMEARKSPYFLAGFVVVTGAVSNFSQYYFANPLFGGMSGVIFGLFGYIWMKSRYHKGAGFSLHRQTVIMMVIWFFVCVFLLVGMIANWCHGIGLAVGLFWGVLTSPGAFKRIMSGQW